MPQEPKLPSDKDFLDIINVSDQLSVAIRGHQLLEMILNIAINESLSIPHALEVRKLSFILKIDLGIALGLIPHGMRGGFAKINEFRNRFAHDPAAKITEKESKDFYNSLPSSGLFPPGESYEELGDPLEAFRNCCAVLFFSLERIVQHIRDQKLYEVALNEVATEILQRGGTIAAKERGKYRGTTQKKIEEKYHRLKKELLGEDTEEPDIENKY